MKIYPELPFFFEKKVSFFEEIRTKCPVFSKLISHEKNNGIQRGKFRLIPLPTFEKVLKM